MKSPVIVISSSDEDYGDHDGNSDEEVEELESIESDDDDDDDDDVDYDCDYDDDDDYNEQEEIDVESKDDVNVHSNCHDDRGVPHQYQGSDDLSLTECKEYLRKHGLRLSGTKEECLQRIKEHKRLKDGRGESLYPRSSFSVNCTGDACKGDVVLFRQKVHNKQTKVVGKRTVAGKIIKESYGASKQQHTFTIEVFWSKPSRNLPSLSTLLVKGRNLYKFGTFRQPWNNERDRSKVLGEKHTRGEEARNKRKLRRTDIPFKKDKGAKRQKFSHGGPSQSKHQSRTDKHKSSIRGAAPAKKNTTAYNNASLFQKTELKRSIRPIVHSYPNRSVYSDHHLQEAPLPSSSFFPYDTAALPSFIPFGNGNSGYSRYNNKAPQANNAFSQPPRDYYYNYERPFPRYRFG
ncbi:uncharacterized protein [Rutidosis leptorrhynchoides]|uniref:uncharacterized protein n=1 Tax=Rutidosis leptorrhynchoides TaxID=125765 RepID=UPI003A9A575E